MTVSGAGDMALVAQEFSGRVAVVTGAGRGFGKEFARELGARGPHVALLDCDAAAVKATAAELRDDGMSARAFTCDVAKEDEVQAAVACVADEVGGIDLLINNAGLHSSTYNQPFGKLGIDRVRRLLDVNVLGIVICSLAVRPFMLSRAGAAIVNISSVGGYECLNAYGVSKLAVRGLTVAMAREFSADAIRVNAIAPGLIVTETIAAELPKEHMDLVLSRQLVERAGEQRDIVEMLLFLATDRSSFITGETFRVSGGYSLVV